MNHIYRLVFNRRMGQYQAVPESASAQSGKNGRSAAVASACTGLLALLLSPAAPAGPLGGQVVSGAASINQTGSTTTIHQTSQNTALNWQSFCIRRRDWAKPVPERNHRH